MARRMRLGVARAWVRGTWVDGDVAVADGRIVDVGLLPGGRGTAVPGFVDLQVNGFGGVDLLAATREDYATVRAALATTGVTAFQPTLITSEADDVVRALTVVGEVAGEPGVRVLGAHLEGPFLSSERAGTHPVELLRAPDPGLVDRFLAAGPVTQVTLAPELPGALALVRRLHAAGVLVSVGHTDATAAEAHEAFDAGARTVTHLFNAMRRFTPRDPGVAGAALARTDVVVQVIVDRTHLADDTVRLVLMAAQDRMVLVTDAIAAAGVGDGTWRLGDVEVTVRGGEARRGDGVLAGSVLTLDAAVRNVVDLGWSLEAVLPAVTARPAELLGHQDVGGLQPGAVADVTVLDDALAVRRTLVGGVVVHD